MDAAKSSSAAKPNLAPRAKRIALRKGSVLLSPA